MSRTDTDRPVDATEWYARIGDLSDLRPTERDRVRGRLASAIRAAHGVRASFGWRVASGRDSLLSLWLGDPAARAWFARTLRPAYEQAGWAPRPGPDRPSARAVARWGLPLLRWPAPFRSPAHDPPLLESLIRQMSLAPPGLQLLASFRPAPLLRPGPAPDVRGSPENARRIGPTVRRPASPAPGPVVGAGDAGPLWTARIGLVARGDAAAGGLVEPLAVALESASRSAGNNGLRFVSPRRAVWIGGASFCLRESDLLELLPRNDTAGAPAPTGPSAPLLPLGRAADGHLVGPPVEPTQGRHLAVLGETGMGKSSLLVALGRWVAREHGLLLFDPLGETARSLEREIAGTVGDRLLTIRPSGHVRLNALAGTGANDPADPGRERRLNDLVHSLRRVRGGRYADGGFWGPRLEEMLTRALGAAAALPGGTLVDAHALLAAEGRGHRVVPTEAMDAVRALADRIRGRPEDADGARRLLYEVVRSGTLTRLLCATEPDLAPAELVAPGRVVLWSGEAARVGESTARYLMAIGFAMVWAELLSRPVPSKTWVILDEAQWFVHESLSEMLRLGRRCNVHIVLATQALDSLPESVAESVWTNASDFVAFRGSPADARELSRVVPGVSGESLLALARGEAWAFLGKGQRAERVRTVRVPRRSETFPPSVDAGNPRPVAEAPDPAVAVHAWIRRRVARGPGSSPVRVPLRLLRAEADPGGEQVRSLGRHLAETGAIVRIAHEGDGTVWYVDPTRLKPDPP